MRRQTESDNDGEGAWEAAEARELGGIVCERVRVGWERKQHRNRKGS